MAIPKLLDLMRNSASKEYVDNNGGTFEAEYGVTTYEEIVEAFNQGKVITCNGNNRLSQDFLDLGGGLFSLGTYPTGTNTLYFYDNEVAATNCDYANTIVVYISINSDSNWSYDYKYINKLSNALYLQLTPTPFYESDTKRYYRPIICSTSEPTASDGNVGDIWIQYEE